MNPLNRFIRECQKALSSHNNPEVNSARDYLHRRKVLDSTINLHTIGYSYNDDSIPDEIRLFGAKSDRKCDCAYFIRGHVIVPIYAEFGNAVGLATRKPLSTPGNTWWNLPAPFRKGSHLFLLNIARQHIFDKNKVYIVEGYMDAILLYQAGLTNVVSLMGTALTLRKIGLIARYCNNVCVCMDVDKNNAGQYAQDECIASLKKFEFCESISIIDGLPVGTDPDEFVMENGLDRFLAMERTLSSKEINDICSRIQSRKRERQNG